jgi:hypothetical protein
MRIYAQSHAPLPLVCETIKEYEEVMCVCSLSFEKKREISSVAREMALKIS